MERFRAVQFFAANRGHVCGRFLPSQLNRPIDIPYQPHSHLYRWTIALGLTLLFTQAPDVRAQQGAPRGAQTPIRPDPKKTAKTGKIKGTVLDERKEPVVSAAVQVFDGILLVGGVISDYDGKYEIGSLSPGRYRLVAWATGYDSTVITEITVEEGRSIVIVNVDLKPANATPVVNVLTYKQPKVDERGAVILTEQELKLLPTGGVYTETAPALYQSRRSVSGGVSSGTHYAGTLYTIDGVQVEDVKPTKKSWWKKMRRNR